MEIEITARATGPYGELSRRQRFTDKDMPQSYLNHLVDIGVAKYIVNHKVEKKLETKVVEVEAPLSKKTLSASQPDPASQEKTPKKRRGRPRKSSS